MIYSSLTSLVYDAAKNTYNNQSGVEVKTSGFGDTCKVEYLTANPYETSCTWQLPAGNYLHTFVDYFVDLGYQRGKTIRAAPYDWRLAAGTYVYTQCAYTGMHACNCKRICQSDRSCNYVTAIAIIFLPIFMNSRTFSSIQQCNFYS